MPLTPKFARLIGLIAGLLLALPALAQEQTTLTLPQVRALAQDALAGKKPRLALRLSEGLLLADKRAADAHFIAARAHHQMRDYGAARRSAARAFRFADHKQDRFLSAQFAARAAYSERRFTASQYWLRRSLPAAPSEQHRAQTIQDFKRVRAENPWHVGLRFALVPSSNVNSGSDSALSLIDGVPIVGLLSGDAQALSGMIATADINISYRLGKTASSRTEALARIYRRQIFLSDAARALSPTSENSDFSASTLELGLRHSFRIGADASKGSAALTLMGGKSYYAGAPLFSFVRLDARRGLPVGASGQLSLSFEAEHRIPQNGGTNTTNLLTLRGFYAHELASGARLTTGLIYNRAESDSNNVTSDRFTGFLGYTLANPVVRAKVSLSLGASLRDYPQYLVGIIPVPGGRQDKTVFANIKLDFAELDYAGFHPSVTLRAQKTNSNVSRFDTTEFAVSLGIRSSF